MSKGVSVQGVSVQGVSVQGVYVLVGYMSLWGKCLGGGGCYVLEPYSIYGDN